MRDTSTSIHPRVSLHGEKHSTCKARKKPGRIERVLTALERHLEQHPNDAMSQRRRITFQAQT